MPRLAFTLRLANFDDAESIAVMSRDLIEAGLGWRYRPDRILKLMNDPDTVTLVAADGEQTAGFAIMSFGDEHATLVLLAVRPSYQRNGVASSLLAWLTESATTAGMAFVHLQLRAGNIPARAFYRAMGFAETTVIPGYYRGYEPALLMMRVLRQPVASPVLWRPPSRDRG